MTTAVALMRLFFYCVLPEFFFAIFRTEFLAESFGVIFIFFQDHFANRTFFFEEVKHDFIAAYFRS